MTHYIRILSACLLTAMAATGCNNDLPLKNAEGTATVCLNIPQLETTTRVPVAGDENAINNLRVIILSQGAESINRAFTKEELAQSQNVITINNVPVGPVQMYVIANEASLGKDYSNLANLQDDVITAPGTQTRKVLIMDEGRIHFPKRGSEFPAEGLPMSWMNQNLTILPPAEQPQSIPVELERAVAKLNIQMSNTLSDPITIDQMKFGSFFADRIYLFQEDALNVPTNALYTTKDYMNLDITIPGGGTESLVLYAYPSAAAREGEETPYSIGFHTLAGVDYPLLPFLRDGLPLTSMSRNTQVNIYATLSADANIKIYFEVKPWNTENITVPPFN